MKAFFAITGFVCLIYFGLLMVRPSVANSPGARLVSHSCRQLLSEISLEKSTKLTRCLHAN